MKAHGHKPRNVGHIHHEQGVVLFCNSAYALKINGTGIGRRARHNQLRVVLARFAGQVLIIQKPVFVHAVRHEMIVFAAHVHRAAVREVAAVGKVHAQHSVAHVQKRKIYGQVGLRARMGLHIGMLRAEQAAGALARDVLYFVHPGAAAVIAAAGVALGILVRQHAAHCGQHGGRYHVFRGNQFNVPALAAKLALHGPRHLCIALGHKADGVQHIRVHVHPPYLVVFQLSFSSIQRNAVVHKRCLCYDKNGRRPAVLRRFCHMRTKQDALQIVNRLKEEYPLAECTLDYDSAWQLLVSVRLHACDCP